MSVNDVLCQGAESLCFSDDFSCSRLSVEVARSVIEGISIGCRQAGCALIGTIFALLELVGSSIRSILSVRLTRLKPRAHKDQKRPAKTNNTYNMEINKNIFLCTVV